MKISFDEFQSLANDSDERYEYIDGHVYALASPTVTHQIIHSNLYKILTLIFDRKKCRVFSAPFDVTLKNELSGSINVLQPDAISVFTEEDNVTSYTFPEVYIKAGDIFSDI